MEFITTVIKFIDETDKLPWTSQEFLDLRDGEGGSKDGSTALHVAITQGSIQAAICFIDLGADIFVTYAKHYSAIYTECSPRLHA